MISLNDNEQLSRKELERLDNDNNDYTYLLFGNKMTGKVRIVKVPKNKLLRSKIRFSRKIEYNSNMWYWWLTFTFADKIENYQIDYLKFKPYYTLKDVHKIGMSSYVRAFFNSLRTDLKKKNINITYFWIYEQGGKNNREHFHVGLNDIGIRSDGSHELPIRKYLYNKWKSGNINAEPIKYNKGKISNYLNAYVKKEHSNYEKYTGNRFWSTSRDIVPVPKDKNLSYLGYSQTFNLALFSQHKLINSYESHNNFNFFTNYFELLQDYRKFIKNIGSLNLQLELDFFLDEIKFEIPTNFDIMLDYIDGAGCIHDPNKFKSKVPIYR